MNFFCSYNKSFSFEKMDNEKLNNISYDLSGKGLKFIVFTKKESRILKKVFHLDISNNFLKDSNELIKFSKLRTLILDNNYFSSIENFPTFKNLETFSANKNNFSNFTIFIENFINKYPNAIHLSLLNNPFTPSLSNEKEYLNYQKKVFGKLKNLKILDGSKNPDFFNKTYSVDFKLKNKININFDNYESDYQMLKSSLQGSKTKFNQL